MKFKYIAFTAAALGACGSLAVVHVFALGGKAVVDYAVDVSAPTIIAHGIASATETPSTPSSAETSAKPSSAKASVVKVVKKTTAAPKASVRQSDGSSPLITKNAPLIDPNAAP